MRSSAADAPPRLHGLPPIVDARSRVLILGSFPSEASLRQREYYAHPRNLFWPIMDELFGVDRLAPYNERVAGLLEHQIAVWDVILSCQRQGSADGAIKDARPNALIDLLAEHALISHVAFNGGRAEATASKSVPELFQKNEVRCQRMPSTSPANASIPLASKIDAWSALRGWARLDG